MDGRWKGNLVSKVIRHEPDRQLALAVGLLIDRGGDDAFVKIRSHLREKIGGNQFHFSSQAMGSQGAAHRKTVHGIHVESSQVGGLVEQLERLLKTLILVFVPFNDRYYRSSRAMPWKGLGEAIRLPAMIFRTQHARNEGHSRTRRNKLSH